MKTSFTKENKTILGAIIALAAFTVASTAFAEESVIAIGKVSSAGAVTHSSNTVSGVVTASRPAIGQYHIEITSIGAFAGTAAEDFVVNIGVEGSFSDDVTAVANVQEPTADVLTIDVNVGAVEDSTDVNAAEERNNGFFFVIHRIPSSEVVDPGSRYLVATGTAGSGGGVGGGVSPQGYTVAGSRNSAGNYELSLSKAGAFIGDSVNDYVILLTVDGLGPADRIIRGDGATAVSDDEVLFDVRVDDAQDESNDSSVTPSDRAYQFTIYRVSAGAEPALPDSKLLRALGSVDGSTGDLINSASIAGGMVTSSRTGTGDYEIFVTAPGKFANSESNNMVVQVLVSFNAITDEVACGRATVVDADTVRIDVGTADVEQSGTDNSTPLDRDFFFVLHEAKASPRSDMHIGRKRSLSKMKGDNRYNLNAAGQKIRVKANGRSAKYFFAVENDGDVIDDLLLRQKGQIRGVKAKFFRLSGGRKNVTGKVKSVGYNVDTMRPDKNVRFQVKTRFLSNDTRRGKVRLRTSSGLAPTSSDTILSKIIMKN